MEVVIPPGLWTLLKKCFHDEDAILDCKISSGSNPGDNVIGKMLSVKISTTTGGKHDLVVKASIPFRQEDEAPLTKDEKLFAELVAVFGSYQTELAYYQRIQPGIDALLNKGFSLPTPKIYFGQNDEENGGLNACLILQDLRPERYKMADKMQGLTMEEVTMVLEKIARFHAASYVYLRKSNVKIDDESDPLSYHVFEKMQSIGAGKIQKDFLEQLCFDTYELGKETGVISKELHEKMSNLTPSPATLIVKSSKQATIDYFPVVIHGDLWINNILFKYDEQDQPIDAKFIDFQQSRYASVFDELHYFIYTSTTTTFRQKNLDVCLDFYFRKFHETLQTILGDAYGADQTIIDFTSEVFQNGFKKYLGAAFCYGTIAIPFQLGVPVSSEPDEDAKGKAENVTQNADPEDSLEEGKQASSSIPCDKHEELGNFATKIFHEMRSGLKAAAKNSPEALKRFGELCKEMEELGLFTMSSEPLLNIPNRRILDKHFVSQIVGQPVKEYAISAGSKPGDNVMGTLLCVDVKTPKNEIHNLVIKSVLPMTGVIDRNTLANSKLIAATKVYKREIDYYNIIRPIFQKAWEGNAERVSFFTTPKLYSWLHDPDWKGLNDYMVLEDLRPLGYKMVDKRKGLSYEEMITTLKQLAVLHATSYSVLNGNNSLSAELQAIRNDPNSLINVHGWDRYIIERCDQSVFFNDIVTKMVELVEEGGQVQMAKKIHKIAHDGFDKILMKLWEQTTDQGKYFRVLIHGDFWTNNVLIKHASDGKAVEDVKFIDFQMVHFGNIYEELQYFIFTSTTAEFRQAHLKSCLQVYYKEFETVIQQLGSSMPPEFTEESLISTFHETLNYGFVYNILAIPYQLGLPPPPQSPMTPVEVNFESNPNNNLFFSSLQTNGDSSLSGTHKENAYEGEPDFQKMLDDIAIELQTSAKNSPLALLRLHEMIAEMVDFGLIQ